MKFYGILVLILLASCGLMKQQEKVRTLTDSLRSHEKLGQQLIQQCTAISSQSEAELAGQYNLVISSQGPYTWHPDSGLKADKGKISLYFKGEYKQQHQETKRAKHHFNQEFKEQQKVELKTRKRIIKKQKGLNHLSLIWKLLLLLLVLVGLFFLVGWLKRLISGVLRWPG